MFDAEELIEISGLGAEEVVPTDLAAAFLTHGKRKVTRKGQTIIDQGTDATDVYYIVSGKVRFDVVSSNGKLTILRHMGPGQLFGEMAILGDKRRSASATVLEGDDIRQVSGAAFTSFLQDVPGAGHWLATQLAARVRHLTEKCSELATLPVSARIHIEILREAQKVSRDGDRCEIPEFMIHADLAARIGSHREAVTRELGQLEKEGIISRPRGALIIHSLSRLQALKDRIAAR